MFVLTKKNAITCYLKTNRNTLDEGFSISGQVKALGIPIKARVRVFDKNTGLLVRDVATDAMGNYRVNHLEKVKYFIVSHHLGNQYNAVIQDNVVPK